MKVDDQSKGTERIRQLKSRLSELTFLHETSQLLTATLDLDDVLRALMSQVRDYFDVEAISVALLDEESEALTFRVAIGEASEAVTGLSLPVGEGIAGWVVQEGEIVLISDAYTDPRFYADVDQETGFETETVLAVPIKTGSRTIGAIEVMNPSSGTFDEKAPELLTQVASQAAAAIRNAELYERARQAERRYESLFHTSPAPNMVMDFDTRILDCNQEACKVLGRPIDELVGSLWYDLVGDQRSGLEAPFRRVHDERQVSTEMRIPTPAGLRVLEVHMTTIDYGGREAIQWIGHDVTEQTELERMRDDLMHMIVHDLRNPLGNIISSLQMIRTALVEHDTTLPMLDVLRVAMRSSEKLRRLIDSLLSLRQLEEGKADLDRRLVPPIVLTREAVELVRPMIEKKEQRLVLDIPPDVSPVHVDRDMISRVLTNLLDNAAKFTPTRGKIELTIAEQDDRLIFIVSDTGPGIPPDSEEHLFERFTRLESAKGTQGTGLGLPFCKLAVEAHGGNIWVESAPGEGSTFKFSLPLEAR
jgi:NtrC-family two-component system sensor histidine kinase KinB